MKIYRFTITKDAIKYLSIKSNNCDSFLARNSKTKLFYVLELEDLPGYFNATGVYNDLESMHFGFVTSYHDGWMFIITLSEELLTRALLTVTLRMSVLIQ